MAYVPPALRKIAPASPPSGEQHVSIDSLPTSQSSGGPFTTDEIAAYYWSDLNPSDASLEAGERIEKQRGRTLNASAALPDSVSHVMLFHGANPQWEDDGIVFVRSNLHLLPGYKPMGIGPPEAQRTEAEGSSEKDVSGSPDTESKPSPDSPEMTIEGPQPSPYSPSTLPNYPIAVFIQPRPVPRTLDFLGFFRIARVEFIPPSSLALVKMLEQKWTVTDRFGNKMQRARGKAGWEQSMQHQWAVLKFEQVGVGEGRELEVPRIQRIEGKSVEGARQRGYGRGRGVGIGRMRGRGGIWRSHGDASVKSVNESLREMGLADGVQQRTDHPHPRSPQ